VVWLLGSLITISVTDILCKCLMLSSHLASVVRRVAGMGVLPGPLCLLIHRMLN
jgi:hypothetical protein